MSKNLKLLLKYATAYRLKIFLTVVLGFSSALFNGVSTTLIVPVVLSILGQSLDLNGSPAFIKALISPFNEIDPQYRVLVMTSAIILAIALKNLNNYLVTVVSGSLTKSLMSDLRRAGLDVLLNVDLDFYTKTKVGDLVNRINTEVRKTATAVNLLISILTTSITILVFAGLLLSISWQLTLVSTFLLSLVILFNQIFIKRAKKWGEKLSNASRDYAIGIIEALNGIRLVKSMGHENREYEKITKLISKLEKSTYKSDLNYAIISPINEVVSIIVILLIVISGRVIFADNIQAFSAILLTYLFLLFRTLPLVSSLNNARSQFANNSAGVTMVEDLLRRDNKPFMIAGTLPYNSFEKGIHFNNISFGYPEHDNLVLKNIDLYIPRGTTLALVGGSGAGKSTLADLLPRFYDPNEGSIEIDGLDIRQYNLQSLRQAMGVVSQDTFLFNSSIRDNIAYARPEATDEEIIEASKRANAHEFIDRLPEGFDTLIGDRGVLLSGGQRQRLSIARALLRNPEILILDEATSALDTVSERLVQEAIDALSRERTTIVIAHRLSTVQSAHQIAVLEKGEVVELGTHDELLKLGGHFARLYTLQFAEEAARDEALIQSSYEVRTRLNPMIGFLRLLIDGMADTPEEQEELLLEAYRSATSIFKNIEFIEQSVKLRLKKQ